MTGETVTRQRGTAGDDDRYGNPTVDWSDPDELRITGAALAPVVAPETTEQGRQGTVIGWELYVPDFAPDVLAGDRIVARGDTYEVDGEPAVWVDAFSGATAGVVVALKRVEG